VVKSKSVVIVGAGFGGLTLGALLARQGMHVRILERNEDPGGRARVWRSGGFSFDMGPTWYLMPEVFEDFFALFGRPREEFYSLATLDPSYRVFFGEGEVVDIVPELAKNLATFERLQPGGAAQLEAYLDEARYKYDIALKDFLYRDYTSIFQFFNRRMMVEGMRLNVFQSLDRYTRRSFTDRRARQLLEYHMVFLGNSPDRAPALYSLMSHADLNLGVFYPMPAAGRAGVTGGARGIGAVVQALVDLNRSLGVEIITGQEVDRIEVRAGAARGVHLKHGGELFADLVAVNADYQHAETALLAPGQRSYGRRYWERRVIAPSMFLIYLGLDRRLRGLAHHSLYFAEDWNEHFATITDRPSWPEKPCFYLCAPARTDPGVAPPGGESLTVLVPIAAGLPDTAEIRAAYREKVLDHVEAVTGERIRDAIRVERIFTLNDFSSDYNAFKGTALGLAHTLLQTAVFRPAHRSRTVADLWYTGGYTHPGIGVPMAFISSRIVAEAIGRRSGG
jgi:phytoene desaturase